MADCSTRDFYLLVLQFLFVSMTFHIHRILQRKKTKSWVLRRVPIVNCVKPYQKKRKYTRCLVCCFHPDRKSQHHLVPGFCSPRRMHWCQSLTGSLSTPVHTHVPPACPADSLIRYTACSVGPCHPVHTIRHGGSCRARYDTHRAVHAVAAARSW